MNARQLGEAGVAVIGLDTTHGHVPPLITQVAVVRVDAGAITAGPFTYWVAPDAAMFTVRHDAWNEVRSAPAWSEVAERVRPELDGRVVVTHEARRLDVLRTHLPDWEPAGVAHTRDLAEKAWPGQLDYSLGAAAALAQLAGVGPDVGPAAEEQALAVALLLAALIRRGRGDAPGGEGGLAPVP